MKTTLEYFEEIISIPRESGKEDKIANYLVSYAKENNLEYSLGKYNTVFLRKNNNSDKTIILQAHSDMVCVSTNGYDFDNKGIPFYIDGDYYKAKDTSLGADDGIGLAIILAILQEKDRQLVYLLPAQQTEVDEFLHERLNECGVGDRITDVPTFYDDYILDDFYLTLQMISPPDISIDTGLFVLL